MVLVVSLVMVLMVSFVMVLMVILDIVLVVSLVNGTISQTLLLSVWLIVDGCFMHNCTRVALVHSKSAIEVLAMDCLLLIVLFVHVIRAKM